MSNINIGRYREGNGSWSGWIEGTREDGTSWITFLDENGAPSLHYPNRDERGGVIGEPIVLSA